MHPAAFIPWVPAAAAGLAALCCTKKPLRPLAAPIVVVAILTSFVLSVLASRSIPADGIVPLWEWISVGDPATGGLESDISYFLDPLTVIMLFVVTGIGSLIAIYASGYMKGERGYARFFAAVGLFIFSMTTVVLAENLVLLYLGWEVVGLCSYLLIGFFYQKPAAVAAAKKAFIVNRIGDLGFALGIFLAFTTYGTVHMAGDDGIIAAAKHLLESGAEPTLAHHLIPFLLLCGAIGKSAQIPLYVWLPDAMEGPTPVSALIHAATMVTSGVYMVSRLLPVFEVSPYCLPTIATIGGVTALFGATIAIAQSDLKKVFAYSTVSQLGYMFLGVGVLSTFGGVFHLVNHAFFKALLFLTAGNVMHALAGQLDLGKMSGLRRHMPVTCLLMLAGCLALGGFPFTSGFFSKDLIIASALEKGLGEHGQVGYLVLGFMGLLTAFITVNYAFRVWFRAFLGPTRYELGDEHHAGDDNARHGTHHDNDHTTPSPAAVHVEHHHEPHEQPWLMNGPLVVLALGALLSGGFLYQPIKDRIKDSTANPVAYHAASTPLSPRERVAASSPPGEGAAPHVAPHPHPESVGTHAADPHAAVAAADAAHHGPSLLGTGDLHFEMEIISGVVAVLGILAAAYFHWLRRDAGDRLASQFPALVRTLAGKYYIDELYAAAIVTPLRALGYLFFIIDDLVIHGLVITVGFIPRALGLAVRPAQSGKLQGYGVGMVAGAAAVVLVLVMVL